MSRLWQVLFWTVFPTIFVQSTALEVRHSVSPWVRGKVCLFWKTKKMSPFREMSEQFFLWSIIKAWSSSAMKRILYLSSLPWARSTSPKWDLVSTGNRCAHEARAAYYVMSNKALCLGPRHLSSTHIHGTAIMWLVRLRTEWPLWPLQPALTLHCFHKAEDSRHVDFYFFSCISHLDFYKRPLTTLPVV